MLSQKMDEITTLKSRRMPQKMLRGELVSHVQNGDLTPGVRPHVVLARAASKTRY